MGNRMAHKLWVLSVLRAVHATSFVEVGVGYGELLEYLCQHGSLREYIGVDPWVPYQGVGEGKFRRLDQTAFDRIYQNVKGMENRFPILRIVRCASVEAASKLAERKFDMIFIDSNHSYTSVKEDIHHWWPLVREQGVLAGHDYSTRFRGHVVKAVDEFVSGMMATSSHCWGAVKVNGLAVPWKEVK